MQIILRNLRGSRMLPGQAVMFLLSTIEPLTRASNNLPYLPFWQNAFSAFDLLELSTLKSRRFLFRLPELLSRRGQSFSVI